MIETPIRQSGTVDCPACGMLCQVETIEDAAWIRCEECGRSFQYRQPPASLAEVFALFGYHLQVDWDGQLIVESESPLPEHLAQWLFDHQGEIRRRFEFLRRKAQAVFVGGSMAGRPHGRSWCQWEKTVLIHVKRAHWEVYEFRGDDLRLWFVGRATSRPKARRRCFVTPEP